jgi:hypothetical protein
MAKNFRKAEASMVRVSNISPAALKVILSKIKSTTNPGVTHGSEAFVKGPTDFAQDGSFYKFSRPGENTAIINIQDGSGFKINADIVKDISSGKMGQ